MKNRHSRTEKYNIRNRKFIESGLRSEFELAEERDKGVNIDRNYPI